jgi:hypothetical protein
MSHKSQAFCFKVDEKIEITVKLYLIRMRRTLVDFYGRTIEVSNTRIVSAKIGPFLGATGPEERNIVFQQSWLKQTDANYGYNCHLFYATTVCVSCLFSYVVTPERAQVTLFIKV